MFGTRTCEIYSSVHNFIQVPGSMLALEKRSSMELFSLDEWDSLLFMSVKCRRQNGRKFIANLGHADDLKSAFEKRNGG